jgi:hypothetical protein
VRRLCVLALLAVLAAPAAGWLSAIDRGAFCAMACHHESGQTASCCLAGPESSAMVGCSATSPGALSPALRLGLPAAEIRLFEPVSSGCSDDEAVPRSERGCPRSVDHVPLVSF